MPFTIQIEEEDDGCFLAEVVELPGTLVYGRTRQEAIVLVQAIALGVLADRASATAHAPDPARPDPGTQALTP